MYKGSTQTNKRTKLGFKIKGAKEPRVPWSGAPDCPVGHRTVQCTSGVTAIQRNGRLQRTPCNATVREQCAQKSEQSSEAHRTVNSACPVPLEDKASNGQKLPNPNGWVMWLAHRTVRCAHRQQPSPTALWWLRAINSPPTTTTPRSKFPALHIQYKS